METIKFSMYNVTDGNGNKAKVYYSINNRADNRECVTLYAKNYDDGLTFLPNCHNDSDSMTDYSEKDRVIIFKGEPLYEAALKAAIQADKKRQELATKRNLKWETKKQNLYASVR